MGRKVLTISSLLANLAGTILLFLGLQIASLGNLRMGSADTFSAICDGNNILFATNTSGGVSAIVGQHGGCPQNSVPVAVIVGDHPHFITSGLILIVASTVLGLITEARERTREFKANRAERRRQMRERPD
jgi:hypothetical protein